MESKLSDVERTVRNAANQAIGQAEELAMEVEFKATKALETIEFFVREKPLQTAGIAFSGAE